MFVDIDEDSLKAAGIEYMGIHLADENTQDIASSFEKSGSWIEQALTQPSSKVLVNCWAGCSRSATIAMAFLVNIETLYSSLIFFYRSDIAA